MVYEFKAKLWEYQGEGAWVFVSVPTKYYKEIKLVADGTKKGFGSARVEATIGNSTWKTSIFPDTKSGTYLLPIKKEVRKKESVDIDDEVDVSIKLLNL